MRAVSDVGAPRVLFICVRNSARSQMAEAFLKRACGVQFQVESAGLEPGAVNPLAIATMKEVGVDISSNSTQSVFDVYRSGKLFSYVITVCDEASAEGCPVFPGTVIRLHWNIPDPAAITGSWEERLEAARPIRQMIADRVDAFCTQTCR
ncbi:MAG: arsenate reductase ArsC [Candidatus Cybelea sp.]